MRTATTTTILLTTNVTQQDDCDVVEYKQGGQGGNGPIVRLVFHFALFKSSKILPLKISTSPTTHVQQSVRMFDMDTKGLCVYDKMNDII